MPDKIPPFFLEYDNDAGDLSVWLTAEDSAEKAAALRFFLRLPGTTIDYRENLHDFVVDNANNDNLRQLPDGSIIDGTGEWWWRNVAELVSDLSDPDLCGIAMPRHWHDDYIHDDRDNDAGDW